MSSYQYPPVAPNRGINFAETIHCDTYPAINSAEADLRGKFVYITGASKGVGRATAISFARAGAEGIAIGARSDLSSVEAEIYAAAEAVGKKAPKVLKLKLDVGDQAVVDSTSKEIENAFGQLDILINNAGYLSEFKPLIDTDPVKWWMNYELNLKGVYLVTRSLLPLMLKGGEKTIINISSIGALSITPGASGYQPSKNALLRFTEFICADYAKDGVIAYTMHPGAVKSDLSSNMPEAVRASKYALIQIFRIYANLFYSLNR
jgi:NAD(P)-dependent dehydrogenase (short-subunit alcohol dehydrogenase family)